MTLQQVVRRLAIGLNLVLVLYWAWFSFELARRVGAINEMTLGWELIGGILTFAFQSVPPLLAVIALTWRGKQPTYL